MRRRKPHSVIRAHKKLGCWIGKSVQLILSCNGEGTIVPKFLIPHCQENPLVRKEVPVPQTDTGRRGENAKVSGRTLVKELGRMTPSLRETGCFFLGEAAVTGHKRLASNETG